VARRDVCWLLISAIALIASVMGHALQLQIESMHLLGGARAMYSHSLQSPFAYIAFGLLLVSAVFIARGVIESVRDELDGADWLLPALDAVRSISPSRLVTIVVGLQLTWLTLGELSEQALSSYDGFGMGAIFGPGHVSAPFVHIAVGAVLALALRAFARAACDRVAAIARFVLVVVERLSQPAPVNCAPALRVLTLRAETPSPPLLARHIASRPPPVRLALVA
jgi:hypothetical protein